MSQSKVHTTNSRQGTDRRNKSAARVLLKYVDTCAVTLDRSTRDYWELFTNVNLLVSTSKMEAINHLVKVHKFIRWNHVCVRDMHGKFDHCDFGWANYLCVTLVLGVNSMLSARCHNNIGPQSDNTLALIYLVGIAQISVIRIRFRRNAGT